MRSRFACSSPTASVSGPFTTITASPISRRSCAATYSVNAASPLGMSCALAEEQAIAERIMSTPQRRVDMASSRDQGRIDLCYRQGRIEASSSAIGGRSSPFAARRFAPPAARCSGCHRIAVARLDLLGELGFGQHPAGAQPHLRHLAGTIADAADRLPMAGKALGERDAALVAARYLELAGIGEGIDEPGPHGQHLVA